jgi:hypothetical protein
MEQAENEIGITSQRYAWRSGNEAGFWLVSSVKSWHGHFYPWVSGGVEYLITIDYDQFFSVGQAGY